jgi:hypothetical protein
VFKEIPAAMAASNRPVCLAAGPPLAARRPKGNFYVFGQEIIAPTAIEWFINPD